MLKRATCNETEVKEEWLVRPVREKTKRRTGRRT